MIRPYPPHAYSDAPRARCYWPTTVAAPRWPAFEGDGETDIAVIGAGYTGLTCALHLAEAGEGVTVLEEQQPGWGASGRNGGFCCLGGAKSLARVSDAADRDLYRQAERAAVDLVEAFIEGRNVDVDRHSEGETLLAHSARAWARIRDTAPSLAAAHGTTAELIPREDLAARGMAGPFHGAMTLPLGFALNPLKYLAALARAAAEAGARGHGESPVERIERQGERWHLRTARGTLSARRLVMATNGYSSDDVPPWLAARYLPVQSAVMVTRPIREDEAAVQGWTTRQMTYDSRHLLHYFRRMPDGRMLFGMRGSLGASSRSDRRAEARLRRHFERMFPAWRGVEATHFWSGLISLSPNLTPFCGAIPGMPGAFAALSYHGNGVAMGSYAGALLADLVRGRVPDRPCPAFFARPPRRIPFGRFRRVLATPVYGLLTLAD